MPSIVLRAEPGDYPPTVLLPGDPGRAREVARRFDGGLEGATLLTDHRGLLGWRGSLRGTPLAVQTTGMGAPAMAMVAEELLRVGVTTLIRIGTCGGLLREMAAGDIVVVSAAAPYDGTTRRHVRGEPYVPLPNFELTAELAQAAVDAGLRTHVGPVATVDLLYDPDPDAAEHLRSLGLVALEMESSILFYLAARATAAGREVRAASILTVSDLIGPRGTDAIAFLPPNVLEQATGRMVEVALSVVAPDVPGSSGDLTGRDR